MSTASASEAKAAGEGGDSKKSPDRGLKPRERLLFALCCVMHREVLREFLRSLRSRAREIELLPAHVIEVLDLWHVIDAAGFIFTEHHVHQTLLYEARASFRMLIKAASF
jgi:hypothetical protein